MKFKVILLFVVMFLILFLTGCLSVEENRIFNGRLTEMEDYRITHSEPLETVTPFWSNWSLSTSTPIP